MINHELMMFLTRNMPMKPIDIDGPYLERYFVCTLADGRDFWLHRFVMPDGDRHMHNHPFEAKTVILYGGYKEETPEGMVERWAAEDRDVSEKIVNPLAIGNPADLKIHEHDGRKITPFDWHRIDGVVPDTWTAFFVRPDRLPYWYFQNDTFGYESVQSSPPCWWENYGTRQEQGR